MAEYTKDIYGVQQQIADEKAKSERDFLADSYNLASVQGGMMLANARDIGMRQGNVYANIGRMLTGEEEPVDPRMARMQKLQSIMEQIPEPDTYDEYIKLANLMNQAGLYGDAQEAMKMANEIKSSQPAKSNAWKEYTEMTSNPTPEGFQIWYDKYKVTGTQQEPKEMSFNSFLKSDAYILAEDKGAAIQTWNANWEDSTREPDDDETNFILGDFQKTAYDKLFAENPNMDKKELERQANVAGQKLFDEYETNLEISRSSGNFLDEIHSLQNITNPETIEGGSLYDAKNPNGRTYTEVEAVEQAKQNVRLGADQVYDQQIDEHNLKQTSAYHTASTESADTARGNLNDLNDMLHLFELGAKTGWNQEFKDQFRSAFRSLGFEPKDLEINEVLKTKMTDLALDRLTKLKGAASDKDIDFVLAAGAQMTKSERANEIILKIAKVYAQDEIDLYYDMNKWVEEFKSKNNRRYPSLNAYKIKEKELIDGKEHISKRIQVTMEEVLAIEPDATYVETSRDILNNSQFLDALIVKHGG